jgi:hypothetical protein
VLKTIDDEEWTTGSSTISTPSTLTFAISASDCNIHIKKIVWDFGNGNQQKSITDRKQDLFLHGIECKYKKAHNTTLTVQASVYTDIKLFTPDCIQLVTENQMLKAHYIEPDEFKRQILHYYKTNVFSKEVAESIYKIANRLAFASNFINYTYREDMIGDAIVRMVEALTTRKFDPHKGNPFSYFTKIAFHAFCNRIKREKRIRETLVNYQNDVYGDLKNSHGGDMDDDGEGSSYSSPRDEEIS